MAMVRQLYSISALAVELARDRRTIARALANVRPDGKLAGGHQAWFLASALRALETMEGRKAVAGQTHSLRPKLPLGFQSVERAENPVDQGVLVGLLTLVYRVGALAAAMAVGAGASMRVAFALDRMMTIACASQAEEVCKACGITNGSAEAITFDMRAFDQADWAALAEMADEGLDLKAWEAWAQQRCRPDSPSRAGG